MLRFNFYLLLSLLIFFSEFQACYANICEEDAAKIAISHCYKNFSDLYSAPGVKIRVEKVNLVKLNGINGPVEIFNIIISKYHKQTFIKISDFLLYEVEKENATILTVKNIENDNVFLKSNTYKLFSDKDFSSLESINYEKYVNIIELCEKILLNAIKDEKDENVKTLVIKNINLITSGIKTYRPDLSYKTTGFEQNLRSIMLMQL